MSGRTRIKRPKGLSHGGGGENAPADREIRYVAYDETRAVKE